MLLSVDLGQSPDVAGMDRSASLTACGVLMLVAACMAACPAREGMDGFQLNRYLGFWYELRRYPNEFELYSKCVSNDLVLHSNGEMFLNNRMFNTSLGQYVSMQGRARLPDPEGDKGGLVVTFPGSGLEVHYTIVACDYDNYAMLWSCWDEPSGTKEFYWLLGRSKQLNTEAADKVSGLQTALGIDEDRLEDTDNTDCPNEL